MNKTLLIILGLAVAIGLAFWLLLPAPAPETIDVAETTSTAAAVTPTPAATVPTTTTPEEAVAPVVAQPPLPATPEEPVPAAQPAPASTVATTTAAAADESNVVAEVNGIPIERAALTQGVQTIISQYASVYKQMGQDFESMLAGASGYSLRLGIEAQALERLLFGSIADAEVKQRGLVVTDEELDAEVARWCAELVDRSPTAISIAKRSFNADSENIRGIGALGFQALALYYHTEESKEGAAAFREKRKPNFRGRKAD